MEKPWLRRETRAVQRRQIEVLTEKTLKDTPGIAFKLLQSTVVTTVGVHETTFKRVLVNLREQGWVEVEGAGYYWNDDPAPADLERQVRQVAADEWQRSPGQILPPMGWMLKQLEARP